MLFFDAFHGVGILLPTTVPSDSVGPTSCCVERSYALGHAFISVFNFLGFIFRHLRVVCAFFQQDGAEGKEDQRADCRGCRRRQQEKQEGEYCAFTVIYSTNFE